MVAVLSGRWQQGRSGTARRAAIAALALGGAAIALPGSAAAPSGEGAMSHARPALAVHLPETVDSWSRPAPLRRIEAAGIFDYMDGAGELYLAYRFDHLDVAEYASPEWGEILVELYWIRTSDDAYGLLSGDWGGEPVALKEPALDLGPRALYGAGLLRIWSDDLYARVLATRESEPARRAVLALGRAIVAGRRDPPPPRLATSLPQTAAKLTLRPDSVCFLRSHLVLNSAYFVSQRDILSLGPNVEAVTARYGNARLVLVRYPETRAACFALEKFRTAYLPETPAGATGSAKIEDGWAGFGLSGRGLALAFEAPDRDTAASLITAAVKAIETLEASHE
jgi:hypothetical protein